MKLTTFSFISVVLTFKFAFKENRYGIPLINLRMVLRMTPQNVNNKHTQLFQEKTHNRVIKGKIGMYLRLQTKVMAMQ